MIVIFNGPPGSGKDAAAGHVIDLMGFKHLSFKDTLIDKTCEHFGVTRDWFMDGYEDRTKKETPMDELKCLTKRKALIHVSEDLIKPVHGKDFFGKALADKINPVSDYAISDGGFVDELFPLINTVGREKVVIVQLFRDGCSFKNDSRRYITKQFDSEISIGSFTAVDNQEFADVLIEDVTTHRIHNNGPISSFYNVVRSILYAEEDRKSHAKSKNKKVH